MGLFVRSNLAATGRCSLTWLSSREPADALELVRRIEARARAEGARIFEVAEKRVSDVGPLLRAAGYARVNAMIHMRRTRRRALPPLPQDVAERRLSEAGVDAWVHSEHEAFRGVAFTVLLTREDAERQRAAPGFDEPLLRILVDAEGPLGMLRGLMAPDGTGEVESIGLDARARGRGLGRWLLRRCEELLDEREVVLRVAESNVVARAVPAGGLRGGPPRRGVGAGAVRGPEHRPGVGSGMAVRQRIPSSRQLGEKALGHGDAEPA